MFRPISSFLTRRHARQAAGSGLRSLWTGQGSADARVPLLLFDIANNPSPFSLQSVHSGSSLRNRLSFSPNTIRSRLALHYKGLPYTQSWISYPDIERLWEELRIPPHNVGAKGAPSCTLPILLLHTEDFPQYSLDQMYEANVPGVQETVQTKYGVFTPIVSTLGIAFTLDILFRNPDSHPPLFPSRKSFKESQEVQSIITRLLPTTRRLIIPSVPDILDEMGREYFIRTRKEWLNVCSLDELRPRTQKEADELWREIEDILQPVIRNLHESPPQKGPALSDPGLWEDDVPGRIFADTSQSHEGSAGAVDATGGYDDRAGGADGIYDNGHVRYLSGNSSPTYADFILMAFLAWVARVDMDVWVRLTQHVGGGILEDLWMGCVPYLKSHTYVKTLPWFRQKNEQWVG